MIDKYCTRFTCKEKLKEKRKKKYDHGQGKLSKYDNTLNKTMGFHTVN